MLNIAYLPPNKLQVATYNPRRIPPDQMKALMASIQRFGFVEPVVVNKRTGVLVGGHQRVEAAKRLKLAKVPVVHIDVSLAEEKALNVALNRIGGEFDMDALGALLKDVQADGLDLELTGFTTKELNQLLATPEPQQLADEQEKVLARYDVPDAAWPTDNDWGIPTLDLSMQADAVDLPVCRWGYLARAKRMNGTYLFYTTDEKFEPLWNDPTPVVNSHCVNAVEVNFSCYDQMAPAVVLHQVYRKRWLARYWQSKGVRIFADLFISQKYEHLNLLGIPAGWRAFATRGEDSRLEAIEHEHGLACHIAGSRDVIFLVYAGGQKVRDLCRKNGYTWIEDVNSGEHRKG